MTQNIFEKIGKLIENVRDNLSKSYNKQENLFNSLFIFFLSLIIAFSASFFIQALFILIKELYPDKYLTFVLYGFFISLVFSLLVAIFITHKLHQLRGCMEITIKKMDSWEKTNPKTRK